MLCRKLMASLNSEHVKLYIASTPANTLDIQKIIAQKLGIHIPDHVAYHELLTLIKNCLDELGKLGKQVVIIIDEAHSLSNQAMEDLRLIANLELSSEKLITIILVGQSELNQRLQTSKLRQLAQRITFSYDLSALSKRDIAAYINSRLSLVGYHDGWKQLFSPLAIRLLINASRGIPRLINVLCHKALLIAYSHGSQTISSKFIKMAVADTESIAKNFQRNYLIKITIATTALAVLLFAASHLLFYYIFK
jgi:MSHA biogenesis protein MshM